MNIIFFQKLGRFPRKQKMSEQIVMLPNQTMKEVGFIDPLVESSKIVRLFIGSSKTYEFMSPFSEVTVRFCTPRNKMETEIKLRKEKKEDVRKKIARNKDVHEHDFNVVVKYAWTWSTETQRIFFPAFRRGIALEFARRVEIDDIQINEPRLVIITDSEDEGLMDVFLFTAGKVQIERKVKVRYLPDFAATK